MAVAAVITKIMPESPDADLEVIKKEAQSTLEKEGGMNFSFEEKPIAFGLKAIMIKFAWPEEKETALIEEKLAKIEKVSSITIEDYRRAFG